MVFSKGEWSFLSIVLRVQLIFTYYFEVSQGVI